MLDFEKYFDKINEGYQNIIDDVFVTNLEYTNIHIDRPDKYEDIDDSKISIKWKISLDVHKDGILGLNYIPVSAKINITYVTGYDENEEEIYEEVEEDILSENITIVKESDNHEYLIESCEVSYIDDTTLKLDCRM